MQFKTVGSLKDNHLLTQIFYRDLDKQKALVAKLNAKLEGLKEVFDTVEAST